MAPDRKTVVHKKIRLRQKLMRDIERSAARHDRSVNEEIEFRLQDSFDSEAWRGDRLNLLTLLDLALKNRDQVTTARDDWKSKRVDMSKLANFLEQIKEADEADFQKEHLPEIMKDKPRPK